MLETEVIGKVYEVVGRRFRHLGMVRYYLARGNKDMGLLLKFVIEKVVIILLSKCANALQSHDRLNEQKSTPGLQGLQHLHRIQGT